MLRSSALVLLLTSCLFFLQNLHSAEKLLSLKCQNQHLAGSNADLAADLKREIRLQVLDNKSKAEIDDYLVTRYGEFVLYRPRFTAVTALLWIGPFVLLAGGIAGIVMMARRNARREANPDVKHANLEVSEQSSVNSAHLEQAKKLLQ